MKTRFFSKGVLVALFASLALAFVSCDKDDDDDNDMYTVSGDASGAQEVPAVTTSATGALTGTYNKSTNQLQYNITWTGLSGDVTAAHFHGPAAAGSNAGPIITLTVTTNGMNGNITGTSTLDEQQETDLLNGQIYYNLHTVMNPDGEIRGQVATVAQ
jgi:hypothetical protein